MPSPTSLRGVRNGAAIVGELPVTCALVSPRRAFCNTARVASEGGGDTGVEINRRTVLVGLSSVVLLGTGCVRVPPEPLRVGTNVWPGYEPLYYALKSGLLSRERITAVELASASQVLAAYRNGVIDAAALTLDEVILLSAATPDPPVVVMVSDVSDGADALVARPPIGDSSGLGGRRIGVETTAVGAYVLTRALDRSGLSRAEVSVVPVPVDQHVGAYERGDIDAVVTFEPALGELRGLGAIKVFDTSAIPGEVIDVVAVRSSVLKRRRALVDELVSGWEAAIAAFESDPAGAADVVARREGLTAEAYLEALAGLRLPAGAENLELMAPEAIARLTQRLAGVMAAEGMLAAADVEVLVDGGSLERALR